MTDPRIPMTDQERNLVDILGAMWPAAAAHRINSPGDQQWQSVTERLIDADVISREEHYGVELHGETADVAFYTLSEAMARSVGGTRGTGLELAACGLGVAAVAQRDAGLQRRRTALGDRDDVMDLQPFGAAAPRATVAVPLEHALADPGRARPVPFPVRRALERVPLAP